MTRFCPLRPLKTLFPHLKTFQISTAARSEAGSQPCGMHAGVVRLLEECGGTLAASQKALLNILFTLAQDGWPEVAQPCMAYLRSSLEACTSSTDTAEQNSKPYRHPAPQMLGSQLVSGLCMELLSGLGPSLQQGEQQGALHAQRLSTALQVGQ